MEEGREDSLITEFQGLAGIEDNEDDGDNDDDDGNDGFKTAIVCTIGSGRISQPLTQEWRRRVLNLHRIFTPPHFAQQVASVKSGGELHTEQSGARKQYIRR